MSIRQDLKIEGKKKKEEKNERKLDFYSTDLINRETNVINIRAVSITSVDQSRDTKISFRVKDYKWKSMDTFAFNALINLIVS